MNLWIFSPAQGDVLLNAGLLAQIAGGGTGAISATSVTAASGTTLTAAAMVGGIVVRTGPTAAFTDTTDTAANIVAALGANISVGQTFEAVFKNATTWPQTLAGGTGVTMSAAAVVPPMSAGRYVFAIGGTQASPTVAVTHVSTVPTRTAAEISNPQATALTTAGAGTITAAGIANGITTRTGPTAAFTDTTDTAAAIIAAAANLGVAVGASVRYRYVNNSAWTATVTGGSSVTVSGVTSVPPNSWAEYLVTQNTAGTLTFVGIAQGSFMKKGTFTANGASAVTVSDTAVTATSIVTFTLQTVGGTVGAYPAIKTITPGTGFTVAATASDSSVYEYEIRG